MIERQEWLDVSGEQGVDQPVVEIEAGLVERPASFRQNPGPRDREPISVDAKFAKQFQVLGPAMIVVAGNVPGLASRYCPRRVSEDVPDGKALAVLIPGALNLVRRRRHAPEEPLGE